MENWNLLFWARFDFDLFHIRTFGEQDVYVFITATMWFGYAIGIAIKYL